MNINNIKNVLIIGLGQQGKKYIKYFLKHNINVCGLCKTTKTKNLIENLFNIKVFLDYNISFSNFDFIIVALPPNIQGVISLDILKKGFKNKMLIESPASLYISDVNLLKNYTNVSFFIEEKYLLLNKFLRKINVNLIKNIKIDIYISKKDYINKDALGVSLMHVKNNFIDIDLDIKQKFFNFIFYDSVNIYYNIEFEYKGLEIRYIFNKIKLLQVGNKKYVDNANFDYFLTNIINEQY